jgi:hypothetical protein
VRIITRMLKQRLVYWAYAGVDNFGKPKFSPPVEIRGRWEDCNEQFTAPNLVTSVSSAKVYVGQDVLVKGVLWLSTKRWTDPAGSAIAQLVSTTNPFANPRAFSIQRFDKLPTIRATKFLRTVYL